MVAALDLAGCNSGADVAADMSLCPSALASPSTPVLGVLCRTPLYAPGSGTSAPILLLHTAQPPCITPLAAGRASKDFAQRILHRLRSYMRVLDLTLAVTDAADDANAAAAPAAHSAQAAAAPASLLHPTPGTAGVTAAAPVPASGTRASPPPAAATQRRDSPGRQLLIDRLMDEAEAASPESAGLALWVRSLEALHGTYTAAAHLAALAAALLDGQNGNATASTGGGVSGGSAAAYVLLGWARNTQRILAETAATVPGFGVRVAAVAVQPGWAAAMARRMQAMAWPVGPSVRGWWG